MHYFLSFILVIVFTRSSGQSFSYPAIPSKGKSNTDFIPLDWIVLDSAFGDLNKDGVEDAAIILQHKDSVVMVNDLKDAVLTQPRIIVLLFKNPADNTYELIEQSNSFILKHDNAAMDDPYEGMVINKGILAIKFRLFYNIGSWYMTDAVYQFQYQQGQFVLVGADKHSFHRATHDFEDYRYSFLTKKRTLTKGNDTKRIKKTTWNRIHIPHLKTLKTFTEPFTWEVERNLYL